MAADTKSGETRPGGFTVMELMVVLVLLALLAGIVTPIVAGSIHRAKEAALKEDLFVMRKAIDDYYADNGHYPPRLALLVEKRYIRSLPADPITDRKDSWILVRTEEPGPDGERGITDLRSGSDKKSNAGTPYRSW